MVTRILFVCHGNICRSPMAEFVMKDMVEKAGVKERFLIESAATSTEEIGNGVHWGTRDKLRQVGISCKGKTARQMTKADYGKYDLLLGMEKVNIRSMLRICGGDPEGKIMRLLDFTDMPRDIADPWYSGNFDATYRDVVEGCRALMDEVLHR